LKIFNNTRVPIFILDPELVTGKYYHRIESNEDYYVPINLLYRNSVSSILLGVDGYDMSKKEKADPSGS
jgi:hypothetical protein